MNGAKLSLGLTILGVLGVGTTAWLSVRGCKKAENESEKKKKIIAYVPAIISGVGTAACIIGSHRVSRKEIIALSATCAYLTANRDAIEKKIREKYGEEELTDIRKEVLKEVKRDDDSMIEEPSFVLDRSKKVHFVEWYLGREFYSTLERVEAAEKELNWRFHQGEYVSMNDFYHLLGLRGSRAGWEFGWPANEDYYFYNMDTPIDFENILGEDENGEVLYMIDIRTEPMEGWMDV